MKFAMFRLWAKIFYQNRLIKDTVVEDNSSDTRTKKILRSLELACYEFDLSTPIWLESNIEDFKRLSKTRFTQDNFIDSIDFDYLEIHIIKE